MKYIKESISIIQNRWPEAIILIILPVILIAFASGAESVTAFLLVAFFAFISIVYLGFLRTAFISKDQPQMPMELLKEGSRFFWRFVQLYFAYAAVYFVMGMIAFVILMSLSGNTITLEKLKDMAEIEAIQETVYTAMLIANILVSVLFIKFILFLPALVIVNDITAASSFSLVRYCKLKEAKGLVVLFFTPIAISAIWLLLPDFGMEVKYQKMLAILPTVVNQCLTLITAVAAIRFVACMNLLYDSENKVESELTEGEN